MPSFLTHNDLVLTTPTVFYIYYHAPTTICARRKLSPDRAELHYSALCSALVWGVSSSGTSKTCQVTFLTNEVWLEKALGELLKIRGTAVERDGDNLLCRTLEVASYQEDPQQTITGRSRGR